MIKFERIKVKKEIFFHKIAQNKDIKKLKTKMPTYQLCNDTIKAYNLVIF